MYTFLISYLPYFACLLLQWCVEMDLFFYVSLRLDSDNFYILQLKIKLITIAFRYNNVAYRLFHYNLLEGTSKSTDENSGIDFEPKPCSSVSSSVLIFISLFPSL